MVNSALPLLSTAKDWIYNFVVFESKVRNQEELTKYEYDQEQNVSVSYTCVKLSLVASLLLISTMLNSFFACYALRVCDFSMLPREKNFL